MFLAAQEAWRGKVRDYNRLVREHNLLIIVLKDSYEREKAAYHSRRTAYEAECRRIQEEHQERLRGVSQIYTLDYHRAKARYREELLRWEKARVQYYEDQAKRGKEIDQRREVYLSRDVQAIADYCEEVLSSSEYPDQFPQKFLLDYVESTKTLIVDYYLPKLDDIPRVKEWKYVQSKNQLVSVPLSEALRNKLFDDMVCRIALRTLYELFTADEIDALESIVFNGRVDSIDKATGLPIDACVLSVQAKKQEFSEINLSLVEPKACIRKLKGVASSKLHQLAPVAPIIPLDRCDKRFVEARQVSQALDDSTNLAAMDWEDFEHFIREVFEKEFSVNGGEVKVTQASRDGGVDAVALDPDPIRGGKIVIQAKRYTNPVGVSAVRDFYGTVMNEGAIKGIFVTTSNYGPDAYEFAKGKPLTLLDGGNLLYLLEKHGRQRESTSPKPRKSLHFVRTRAKQWEVSSRKPSLARYRQVPRSSPARESGSLAGATERGS